MPSSCSPLIAHAHFLAHHKRHPSGNCAQLFVLSVLNPVGLIQAASPAEVVVVQAGTFKVPPNVPTAATCTCASLHLVDYSSQNTNHANSESIDSGCVQLGGGLHLELSVDDVSAPLPPSSPRPVICRICEQVSPPRPKHP